MAVNKLPTTGTIILTNVFWHKAFVNPKLILVYIYEEIAS